MARKVPDKSLEIQSNACGRLSPDLVAVGDPYRVKIDGKLRTTFGFTVDKKAKLLTLEASPTNGTRLRLWRTGSQKSSGLIGLKSALKDLGLDPDKLRGESFAAKIEGTKIEVQF